MTNDRQIFHFLPVYLHFDHFLPYNTYPETLMYVFLTEETHYKQAKLVRVIMQYLFKH